MSEAENLLRDAEALYQESLKELAGRIRKAAENAWGATAKNRVAFLPH